MTIILILVTQAALVGGLLFTTLSIRNLNRAMLAQFELNKFLISVVATRL